MGARVVVVGGGVSGLAAAFGLADDHEVTVVEASPVAGGKVRTVREAGLTLDMGANGFLDGEPATLELARRVGLGQDLVRARPGPRFVFLDGRPVALPTGLADLLRSPVLSWRGKLRLLGDLVAARGPAEESVGAFVRRRLGAEVLQRLVEPMVTGIYAGDPDSLSIEACFPRLKAAEREHGSLLRGLRASGRGSAAAAGPAGTLTTFRGGLGRLTEALVASLGARLHTGCPAQAVRRLGQGWVVEAGGESFGCDAVVLALPGREAAALVADVDPTLSMALGRTSAAPVTVACTAYEGVERPPLGFGCLVPKGTHLGVLGTLFTSSTFPDQAPEGTVLLRTLLGGDREPHQASTSDAETLRLVHRALHELVGPLPDPAHSRLFRWPHGIPQYRVGQPQRVAVVREREHALPGLFCTGNHLEGIGVKDCAREAERVAARVRRWLHEGT